MAKRPPERPDRFAEFERKQKALYRIALALDDGQTSKNYKQSANTVRKGLQITKEMIALSKELRLFRTMSLGEKTLAACNEEIRLFEEKSQQWLQEWYFFSFRWTLATHFFRLASHKAF